MTFNKTTLKNGIRLITVPIADSPAVTVLVMVETGSKYEDRENNGISHFLEHMLFKGTNKRPRACDISRELDSIGAHYNAFTGHEFTGYYAKADKKHLNTIVDILSDLYTDPIFDPNEMEKEKGVIIEEIRMYNDLPQKKVQDVFMEILYDGQPAGRNIAGTENNVRSFNREQVKAYHKSYYVAPATTVAVAGNIDESEIEGLIQEYFDKVPDEPKQKKQPIIEVQERPFIRTVKKDTDQMHMVIGVRTFGAGDPRLPAMNVLVTILGRGMSSRLFSKMRDELGICYYIKADQESFSDHGALTIVAGVDNNRIDEAVAGILGECRRLKKESVPDHELQKAKDFISGTTMLELETSDERAEYCAFQEILKGSIESPQEWIAKVNAVTSDDIKALANEFLVNKGLNMAMIGRIKEESNFRGHFEV